MTNFSFKYRKRRNPSAQSLALHPLKSRTMVLLCAGLLLLGGCGGSQKDLPTTYPVTGKVVFSNSQPASGAVVQFRPKSSPFELQASGLADAGGNFTLSLLFEGEKLRGATEGQHQVTVYMPVGIDRAGGGDHYSLDQEYVVEPGDNRFTIQLGKPQ